MAEGTESAENDAHLQSNEQQTEKPEVKVDPSDQLTPEHPRFKEVVAENHELKGKLGELETKMTELQEQITARQDKTGDEDLTDDEEKALDRIAAGLARKGKIVTPEELRRERQAMQYEKLSERYDGSDGNPKFNAADVQAFAKKKGINDLEDAYFLLNRTAISQVEARKLSKTPDAPTTEKATGKTDKEAPKDALTSDDIANMSDEEYEQNRARILGAVKPKRVLQ